MFNETTKVVHGSVFTVTASDKQLTVTCTLQGNINTIYNLLKENQLPGTIAVSELEKNVDVGTFRGHRFAIEFQVSEFCFMAMKYVEAQLELMSR